jgi:hypothetical protein
MQFGHKHAHEHIRERWNIYWACFWESLYWVSHKHADRHTKIMQFGHKHAHEHITECWNIYWESLYRVSHKHAIGTRKLCSLAISMLMSILENVGTYIMRAYENPYMGCLISTPWANENNAAWSLVCSWAYYRMLVHILGVLMRIPI